MSFDIPGSAWSAAVAAAAANATTDPSSQPARGLPPSIFKVAAEQSSSVQPSVINTSEIPETRFGKRPHDNENNRMNNNNNNNHNHRNNKRQRRRGKQQQEPAILPPSGCSVCKIVKVDEPPKYKCPKCRASYCSVACCRMHKTVCPGKEGQEGSSAPDSTGTTKEAAATTASTLAQTQTTQNPSNPAACESDTDDYSDDDDDDASLEDGWKITDDMKVALRNSTWLRTELQDGGLRSMIAKVVRYEKKFNSHHRRKDKWRNGNTNGNKKNQKKNNQQQQSNHPHEELGAKRVDNKNFDVFVDKLLVLADVLERQDGPVDLESSGEQPASFATSANTSASASTSGGGTLLSSNRNEEELEEWLRLSWEQPGMAPPTLALRPRQKRMPKFEPVVLSSSDDEDDDEDDDDNVK
jgi:hypothetical protein